MKKSPFSGKKVKVLLIKPLLGKGNAWDIIEVKTHYALYVLVPNGTAVIYDAQTQNQKKTQMKRIAAVKEQEQSKVKQMLTTIETNGWVVFEKAATEDNNLYDSVTNRSLLAYVSSEYGVTLQPNNFILDKIESLWEYSAKFSYQDIDQDIVIKVIRKVESHISLADEDTAEKKVKEVKKEVEPAKA